MRSQKSASSDTMRHAELGRLSELPEAAAPGDRHAAGVTPVRVTVGAIAYNEAAYLPIFFEDLLAQDHPHEAIDILLVDSASTDATRQVMEAFRARADFASVRILDNPKRIQSAGWNRLIDENPNELLIRLNAHVALPSDFVRKSVARIAAGEAVCGGPYFGKTVEDSKRQRLLLAAESSIFGGSVSPYRRGHEGCRYVDSVNHGTYRQDVFDKAGRFDERLARTEDNEFHERVRRSGYRICLDPEIYSFLFVRDRLSGLLRQKCANGYWIGLTLGVRPSCLSLFHFVPLAFLLGLVLLLATIGSFGSLPLIAMLALYFALGIYETAKALSRDRENRYLLLLPFVFLAMHLVYGAGTLYGLLNIPRFRRKYRRGERD